MEKVICFIAVILFSIGCSRDKLKKEIIHSGLQAAETGEIFDFSTRLGFSWERMYFIYSEEDLDKGLVEEAVQGYATAKEGGIGRVYFMRGTEVVATVDFNDWDDPLVRFDYCFLPPPEYGDLFYTPEDARFKVTITQNEKQGGTILHFGCRLPWNGLISY